MSTDAHQQLLGRVARLYYDHGLKHAEIGALLNLSRIKITRMLAEARRLGVVEIIVHSDERPFADLEQELTQRYGLHSAWICPTADDPGRALNSLAIAGAEALTAIIPRSRRVVIGLSHAVAASLDQLRPIEASKLEILPLGGSRAGRASGADPHELVSALARLTGGTPFHLTAPLIASTTENAAGIREDPDTRAVLAAAAGADALVVGIGGIQRAAQALRHWITDGEFAALREAGAVGDISGRFYDSVGRPVPSEVDDRVVGLTLDQQGSIGVRIGIAGGPEKRDALRTAVSCGLVTVVVTDTDSAFALLDRGRVDTQSA